MEMHFEKFLVILKLSSIVKESNAWIYIISSKPMNVLSLIGSYASDKEIIRNVIYA